jgi:hypothetical protein
MNLKNPIKNTTSPSAEELKNFDTIQKEAELLASAKKDPGWYKREKNTPGWYIHEDK